MKGVLFVAAIIFTPCVVNAACTKNKCAMYCNGAECAGNCTGIQCGNACTGNACAENCRLSFCATSCIGNLCAQNCDGFSCAFACVGKHCANNCSGTQCDNSCLHFKDENCTDKSTTKTITMGANCSADNPGQITCEKKNHPTLWHTLKETETENDKITLPPLGGVQQCYYNTTSETCEVTNDGLPPLLCNHFDLCVDVTGAIPDGSKCTDARKCGRCIGVCEKDSQCKGDLKCFLRTGTETVPGCSSSSSGPIYDVPGKGYCADTSTTDSSTLKGGKIAAIAIGVLALSAAVGALTWCYRTKQGFFGTLGGMTETIKL